ncbi:hypothetical protein CesoFtcFv8_019468 [Champsocephalus esox]|uniref:Uncharacterized protein n=2 Tax=Champsocephalus TaxID=52236 RepID=A0AAN8CWJ4_CHAGU|nr:hypothetical protein CesoFtcFv8_019468 [Champsocephalus esox]KAK5910739.1 hypothetical protein CgunFtcFv8_004976 [Champsocephalus gunnari]
MLENVALRAQKDALIDEVKTLCARLKKGLKPRKQSATAAVLEEEEECIRFKGLAISSTSGINTVASGSETPLKTPVKTLMRSPAASGSETPLKTPVKTLMRSPAASGSETPLKTTVKTVMWSPAASGSETPLKTLMRSPAASGSETPLKTPVKTLMRSPAASGSETPLKTPVKTVMRSPEASGCETPVCQKTRVSVYNKLKANLALSSLVHWEGTGEYHA